MGITMFARLKKSYTHRRCRIFTHLAVLFCLLLPVPGCNEAPPSAQDTPQVQYLPVAPERIPLTSTLPGRVSALVVAEVRPQVEGIIQERLFEEGADVAKGQVLYQIYPAAYRATRSAAWAELEEARAHAHALQKREKRARNLAKANAVSQQELDDAIAEYGKAHARVARAEADLEAAEINLAYTSIRAPVSGRIGRSAVTQGALVTANQSTPLAVIQQIDNVYVDVTQPSADILSLRRMMSKFGPAWKKGSAKARLVLEDGSPYARPSRVQGATPEWILGDLLFSEISVVRTTGNVNLRALFPNPEGLLLPGMYARVFVEEGIIENALLIPQRAVIADAEGGHFVLTLQRQEKRTAPKVTDELFTVIKKRVDLDRPYENRWLVRTGLAAGDLVVVEGLQKAVPGEKASASEWRAGEPQAPLPRISRAGNK